MQPIMSDAVTHSDAEACIWVQGQPVPIAVGRWPQGQTVLASDDHTARLWNAASGKPASDPMVHRASVTAAGFSPDGKRVYTASADGTLRFGDGVSGKPIGDLIVHLMGVRGASIGAAGNVALTVCDDFNVRLCNVA